MPITANLNRAMSLLVLCLSLSACKTKVYWVSGELSSSSYQLEACSERPEFAEASESINRLKWLMKNSSTANDLPTLEWYSREFSSELALIEKVLSPDVTDSKYFGHYQWRIPVINVPLDAKITVEVVSINGAQMSPSTVKIESAPGEYWFIIDRKASEFELCELSSSVQVLLAVNGNTGVLYYYRLIM